MRKLLKKVKKLLSFEKATQKGNAPNRRIKLPITFHSIKTVALTPSNADVHDNEFVVVKYQNKDVWALFRCPCGCKEVISLSLKSTSSKRWKVQTSPSGRPTLMPSVAQTKGCRSHFWLEDGRVYWVYDKQ